MAPDSHLSLVGHGLYDITEIGRLVGVTVDTISRWTTGTARRAPLLEPQLDPFFSFHDLLTVQLIRELSRRRVKLTEIATGIAYLTEVTGTTRPFAHQAMATSGRSWFSQIGGHRIDVGRRGQ